jgi:hypothetical protein
MLTLAFIIVVLLAVLGVVATVHWFNHGGIWGWYMASQSIEGVRFCLHLLILICAAWKTDE